jgi:hypothetical protein
VSFSCSGSGISDQPIELVTPPVARPQTNGAPSYKIESESALAFCLGRSNPVGVTRPQAGGHRQAEPIGRSPRR